MEIQSRETRVTFYVDGFNFYYGLRRTKRLIPHWQHYYWLDVVRFFENFIGRDQILEKVIYFTASPLNPQKSSRQSAFLNANRLINQNRFEVVRGKYLEKHIICPFCKGDIIRPEEKETDVNISLRMVKDCVFDRTDAVVLVSADSDMIPPIEFIRKHYPQKAIRVYFPPSNFSNELRDNVVKHKGKPVSLGKNERMFANAVMPDVVKDSCHQYTIPPKWK